jgi:hypothetical protein
MGLCLNRRLEHAFQTGASGGEQIALLPIRQFAVNQPSLPFWSVVFSLVGR